MGSSSRSVITDGRTAGSWFGTELSASIMLAAMAAGFCDGWVGEVGSRGAAPSGSGIGAVGGSGA